MTVKIRIQPNISKRLIDDDVLLFAHTTAYKLMFDFIPFQTGMLATTTNIEGHYSKKAANSIGLLGGNITDKGIHFTAPYARRMYYGDGFNFRKDKHPLATSRWAEAMLAARGEKLRDGIEKYAKRKAARYRG